MLLLSFVNVSSVRSLFAGEDPSMSYPFSRVVRFLFAFAGMIVSENARPVVWMLTAELLKNAKTDPNFQQQVSMATGLPICSADPFQERQALSTWLSIRLQSSPGPHRLN